MIRGSSVGKVADALRLAGDEAEQGFTEGILRAIVSVRWLTVLWATAGVLIGAKHLTRPGLAAGALALMWLFTALTTWLLRARPATLTRWYVVGAELTVSLFALLVDTHVFDQDRAQSLVWAWPAAGIVTAAIFVGALAGAGSALLLGVASYLGDARTSLDDWGVAASSKTALYMLAAVVASYVARRLRVAEREISTARARDEIARELHDGVLQTLAAVQRRSHDPELAALAEKQDQDLRDYLFGSTAPARTLPVALREVAAVVRARDALAIDLTIDVVVADDLPACKPDHVEVIAGAVGEALTNAAKHASASRVTVYAEPSDDGGIYCSVKDNGTGFDVAATPRRQGITGSIVARVEQIGGRATITSKPGRGTEVQLWAT